MFRLPTIAAALVAASLVAAPAAAEPQRYEIDQSHFSLVFNADHIGFGATWGMFLRGSGSFMFDEDALTVSDLNVEIDTTSVFSNDDRRDGHLRSADFLDAETHPVATFVMTGNEKIDDTTGTITGDLTLRGETRPVTLDVTLNKIGPYPWGDNYVVGVTATTTIKRSDWGMTYALEGGLVGDEVPLVIELEAIRQDGDA
ncbi:MAG: YceI family protein [Pseudomonadota bacterium]